MKIIKFGKRGIALFIILVGITMIVVALPPSPSSFYGILEINGNPAPIGTVISAWIDNMHYPTDTTVVAGNGSYKILSVNGDDPDTPEIEGGRNGDIVVFKIGLGGKRFIADQIGIWNSGTNQKIDLTVTPTQRTITLKRGWNIISLPLDPI